MIKERLPVSPEKLIDIEDPEEARDFIRQRIEEYNELPTVSVPVKYADMARKGIKPHTTWIFDAVIAGMIGRDPYQGGETERVIFRIKAPLDVIIPRFTGADRHFHGVVLFKNEIPPEYLEEIPAY